MDTILFLWNQHPDIKNIFIVEFFKIFECLIEELFHLPVKQMFYNCIFNNLNQ